MDAYYNEYHKQAEHLQYRFQDIVDKAHDPRMQVLHNDMHGLVQDMASSKHPREIENRLNRIDRQIMQAQNAGQELMSTGDVRELHQSYQKMRDNIRRLPNY